MLIDANMVFDPNATAITASADSTNILTVGITGGVPANKGRDLGIGRKLVARVAIQTALLAAGAATLQVVIKGAPDNGSGAPGAFAIYAQTDAIPKANLVAGAYIDIPLPAAPPQAGGGLEDGEPSPPCYYKLSYVVGTGPFTAGTVEAWLAEANSLDAQVPYPNNYTVA